MKTILPLLLASSLVTTVHAALVEKIVTYQQGNVTLEGFTQKEAGNDNSKGAAYNAAADRRSWVAAKTFLTDIFK